MYFLSDASSQFLMQVMSSTVLFMHETFRRYSKSALIPNHRELQTTLAIVHWTDSTFLFPFALSFTISIIKPNRPNDAGKSGNVRPELHFRKQRYQGMQGFFLIFFKVFYTVHVKFSRECPLRRRKLRLKRSIMMPRFFSIDIIVKHSFVYKETCRIYDLKESKT